MDKLDSSIVASSVQSDKAMQSAEKKGESGTGKDELFKLNQLWYKMSPSLSLVSKRTLTKGYFTQSSYPKITGRAMNLVVNTGEFYVNPKTSYLVIQCGINVRDTATGLGADKNAHALLGQGDILSLFDEIFFTSASGTEICRESAKHLNSAVIGRQMLSQEFINTHGETSGFQGGTCKEAFDLKGWGGGGTGSRTDPILFPLRQKTYDQLVPNTTPATTNTSYGTTIGSVDLAYDPSSSTNPTDAPVFLVPMNKVLGCFNPYMSALFPASALAGGVLTIRVADLQATLAASGSGITNTTVAKSFLNALDVVSIYILWDSFQLNDSVLKRLNEVSASSEGLSVMFDTWDYSSTSTSGTAVEAQVSQAKSRVIRSVCVLRDSGEFENPYSLKLASEAAVRRTSGLENPYRTGTVGVIPLVAEYQAQLGSLYFPQQPLTTPEEMVMNAYYVFCKGTSDETDTSSLSKEDFYGALGINHFDSKTGTVISPNTGNYSGNPAIYSISNAPPWSQNWGLATYGFLAERSCLLQLTGLPISNARLLRHKFRFNYGTTSGKNRQIDVFTQYTRVMKVFLGGRVVMRE